MSSIAIVEHGSILYQQAVGLRYRILRQPLGLDFTEEQLAAEHTDIHLVYLHYGRVVGCLVLTPVGATRIKMRQVAVDEAWQGKGIGSQMVAYCETYAKQHGYDWIECHARDTAVPFYKRLLWNEVGPGFTEVTIPHHKMQKQLL
jgi:GNAT superfamily N-acetyltransferase